MIAAVTTAACAAFVAAMSSESSQVPPASKTFTTSNFSYVGAFRLPNTGTISGNLISLAARRVNGELHFFLTQSNWAPIEFIDPGPLGYHRDYNQSTIATIYRDWSRSGGAGHPFYGGKFGSTYKGPDQRVPIGGALLLGAHWHDISPTCCFYASYGLSYGAYSPDWHLLATDLTNPGSGPDNAGMVTTTYGPWRVESGLFPNKGAPSFGPRRASFFLELPDGSMGHGSSHTNTQQGGANFGPSLFGGTPWPTADTPIGFGKPRGSQGGRDTDLLSPDDYLAHYPMYGRFDEKTGGLTRGQPLLSARRFVRAGDAEPYAWEHGRGGCRVPEQPEASFEINPSTNGNVGSWTQTDEIMDAAWITLGSTSGVLFAGRVCTGHNWYSTPSCRDYGPLRRNPPEIAAGGGPVYCPNHNVPPPVGVTGPVCSHYEPVFLTYSVADLMNRRKGAVPDYAPDPTSNVFLHDIDPSVQFAAFNELGASKIGGIYFDKTTNRLYVLAVQADYRAGPNQALPLIHVFNVSAGSASTPRTRQ
jgi:hypothetical protein